MSKAPSSGRIFYKKKKSIPKETRIPFSMTSRYKMEPHSYFECFIPKWGTTICNRG